MTSRPRVFLTASILSLIACSDNGTGPGDAACKADTGSVTATVTTGGSVVFDWNPACAVALLLVELDASDQWVIEAPGLSETSTESANVIVPPVTYGQVPSGAEESQSPSPLVAGQSYDLVLWKVLPAGSTAQCQQRFQNACLLAVKVFTR